MPRNRLLGLLIVVASVLFAVGVAWEKSDGHEESTESTVHLEGEGAEGAEATEAAEAADDESTEEGEEILGIDPESTPLIVLAVAGSLALAAGAWFRPDLGWLLLLIAVSMLAFAVLDVREVLELADESEGGIAVMAGVIAGLHLAAAWIAYTLHRLATE